MKRKLQVFVSSTYTDLVDERQAAVAAILKAGHIPAGMELFTAGDVSQMETIKRWIDESDIYMLILGGRYGSLESTSGISYTELEYDYASLKGKPSFSVVITEAALDLKIRGGGSAFLEQVNPSGLALFRKKVLSNVSSFFSDTKDIRLCIYESMSDYVGNSSLKGWIAAEEIESIQILKDEIRRLQDDAVLITNTKVGARNESQNVNEPNFDLELILENTEISVPFQTNTQFIENGFGDVSSTNLLHLAYISRHLLLTGISANNSKQSVNGYLYYEVFPKLQLHGLSANEVVAGARRSFLNDLRTAFFSSLERAKILKKVSKPT
jgi:hypothetical protein